MSQPADLRSNELEKMRYFIPDLFLQLNSSDSAAVEKAMEQWERAIIAYRKSLQKVRRDLPPQSQSLAELSLHDWALLQLRVVPGPDAARMRGAGASIVLKHDKDIVILDYSLTQKLQLIEASNEWSMSRTSVYWLYDELDFNGKDRAAFVHRILFSDGTTLLIPFSDCRIVHVQSGRSMSHADLMQIA